MNESWSLGTAHAFEIRYNAVARPSNWKFTRTGLDDLLHRIDVHAKTPTPRSGSLTSTPDELTGETTKLGRRRLSPGPAMGVITAGERS